MTGQTNEIQGELVSIAEVKLAARIDADIDAYDALIPTLIASACEVAEHQTERKLADLKPLPQSVRLWIIAQCVHWIQNPEAATIRQLCPSPFLAGLLDPIKTWGS